MADITKLADIFKARRITVSVPAENWDKIQERMSNMGLSSDILNYAHKGQAVMFRMLIPCVEGML